MTAFKLHKIYLATIVGFLLGIIGIFIAHSNCDICVVYILPPYYLFHLTKVFRLIEIYIFAYYVILTIITTMAFIQRPKTKNVILSILAIVCTHGLLTYLGGLQLINAMNGLGDAVNFSIKSGALDSLFME